MGHAAVTTPETHLAAETFARGGIGQAGVETAPFRAFIDDWTMESPDRSLDRLRLAATGDDFSYEVTLEADGPIVLQGVAGYSEKSEQGQASHYYSQPHYTLSGEVTIAGETRAVTGQAWLDREWSSQPLSEDQTGWDWFALHLEGGDKVMVYRLRGGGSYTTGSWTTPDGTSTRLPDGAATLERLALHETAGREIPVRWRIAWPERGLDVTVAAVNPDAYMPTVFPYWEGPVTVTGSHEGVGYLEMTGY